MLLLHQGIVHLVDVVAGKNQHMLRLFRTDRINVLEHCVRCALVPALGDALHRWQNLNELA